MPSGLTTARLRSTLPVMSEKEDYSTNRYPDVNDHDIQAKQDQPVSDSAALDDPEIDESKVQVLPGTGGPDDVGYIEVEPDDYNRSGH